MSQLLLSDNIIFKNLGILYSYDSIPKGFATCFFKTVYIGQS